MHSQRLGLLIIAFFGAVALKISAWVCKTSYLAGEIEQKAIAAPELILGRQAHLILLGLGLVALLAPGTKDGVLTNRLSDELSRLGKMLAAGLAVGLIGTCLLSKQIHADDPGALLSSYVMEAEGEVEAAKREVDNARASKEALEEALASGQPESVLQGKVEAAQPELDRIMEQMDLVAEDDEAGQLALMEAYDSAYGKQAIYENALNALNSARDAVETSAEEPAGDDITEGVEPTATNTADAIEAAAKEAIAVYVSEAEAMVDVANASAEEMRAVTPETFPEFEGKSYLAAGLAHWVGILLGLATLLGLALLPARKTGGCTEQRWAVGSLALLTAIAGTGASQTAVVGPMLIGVPAMEHFAGTAAVGIGLFVFLAVLLIRKSSPFGWIDGLALTGLLGAAALVNLLLVVDNVLANTQVPLSQMLVICLPMTAIVLMWPLGQKAASQGSDSSSAS